MTILRTRLIEHFNITAQAFMESLLLNISIYKPNKL